MKRQKENYRSRKSRKKALHINQFGSANNAPGSNAARRMAFDSIDLSNFTPTAIAAAALGIIKSKRGS